MVLICEKCSKQYIYEGSFRKHLAGCIPLTQPGTDSNLNLHSNSATNPIELIQISDEEESNELNNAFISCKQ
jgi:hypothetical protein